MARGFEFDGTGSPKLVTAFEAFEHFVSPCKELSNLLGFVSECSFDY